MSDETFIDVTDIRCCPRCGSVVKGTFRPMIDGASGLLELPATWRQFVCGRVIYAEGHTLDTRKCDRLRKRSHRDVEEMRER